MVLLLGGSGYIGQAFQRVLKARGIGFVAPSHKDVDAADAGAVRRLVQAIKPRIAINAIGFTGRPNIDGTEREKLRCLQANTLVPGVLAEVFESERIRWGHVSSGCIYDGSRPDGTGFTEEDPPNFAFGDSRAGWYARTKAMAETLLAGRPGCLVWRMRIPFDQFDHPRNYLTKLMTYERLLDVRGSISQLQEFSGAALESLLHQVPDGVYNLTNPGAISTREIVEAIQARGLCKKEFEYFTDEQEFLAAAPERVKRATCTLSTRKIEATGIRLTGVGEAVSRALASWAPSLDP